MGDVFIEFTVNAEFQRFIFYEGIDCDHVSILIRGMDANSAVLIYDLPGFMF